MKESVMTFVTSWSNKEFDCAEDDSIRQTTTIVEEFFSLLIMIVGERYCFLSPSGGIQTLRIISRVFYPCATADNYMMGGGGGEG